MGCVSNKKFDTLSFITSQNLVGGFYGRIDNGSMYKKRPSNSEEAEGLCFPYGVDCLLSKRDLPRSEEVTRFHADLFREMNGQHLKRKGFH